MATPSSNAKSVTGISNGQSARPMGAPAFTAPQPLLTLQFIVPQLAGSIGRVTALTKASPGLIAALTIGAEELLNALVDQSKAQLTFLADVEALADAARTTFSGNLGAGATDLYLSTLGYAFRCNGRELIAPPAKVFDFAYDGPPTAGQGIVAAEAKGSIQQSNTPATIKTTAANGYAGQVASYVGQALNQSTVLHGYAVAIGGPPTRLPVHMHVQETGTIVTPSAGNAPPTSLHLGGSRPKPPTLYQPNARVALGNYRAVFRLMNAGGIVAAIDAALQGLPFDPSVVLPDFEVVQWRGDEYIASTVPSGVRPSRTAGFSASFGLRLDVAQAFFAGLSTLLRRPIMPLAFPMELPVREIDLQREVTLDDGGAEFPDGLAYFGHYYEAGETSGSWNPSYPPLSTLNVDAAVEKLNRRGLLRTVDEQPRVQESAAQIEHQFLKS